MLRHRTPSIIQPSSSYPDRRRIKKYLDTDRIGNIFIPFSEIQALLESAPRCAYRRRFLFAQAGMLCATRESLSRAPRCNFHDSHRHSPSAVAESSRTRASRGNDIIVSHFLDWLDSIATSRAALHRCPIHAIPAPFLKDIHGAIQRAIYIIENHSLKK